MQPTTTGSVSHDPPSVPFIALATGELILPSVEALASFGLPRLESEGDALQARLAGLERSQKVKAKAPEPTRSQAAGPKAWPPLQLHTLSALLAGVAASVLPKLQCLVPPKCGRVRILQHTPGVLPCVAGAQVPVSEHMPR